MDTFIVIDHTHVHKTIYLRFIKGIKTKKKIKTHKEMKREVTHTINKHF